MTTRLPDPGLCSLERLIELGNRFGALNQICRHDSNVMVASLQRNDPVATDGALGVTG
jgi:hypothetical protein